MHLDAMFFNDIEAPNGKLVDEDRQFSLHAAGSIYLVGRQPVKLTNKILPIVYRFLFFIKILLDISAHKHRLLALPRQENLQEQ